jgi:hypothetical protein
MSTPGDRGLPMRFVMMSRNLRADVERFFADAAPEESVLVVDSCGPVITSQFQILHAIGFDRLSRMKAVHAFSGGAFALFVYLGLTSGQGRLSPAQLATPENERRFREFHHPGAVPVVRVLRNMLTGRTVFESARPVHDSLRYILKDDFVDASFARMPANLRLHLSDKQTSKSVEVSHATLAATGLASLAGLPMRDVISLCVSIPHVYGTAGRDARYGDPIYAKDHRDYIKSICASGVHTLVSTPWRTGAKDRIRFVKCTVARHPKFALMADMARMVFNIRNPDWQRYASAAFELPSETKEWK